MIQKKLWKFQEVLSLRTQDLVQVWGAVRFGLNVLNIGCLQGATRSCERDSWKYTTGNREETRGPCYHGRKERSITILTPTSRKLLISSLFLSSLFISGLQFPSPIPGSSWPERQCLVAFGYLSVSGWEASQLNKKSAALESLIAPPSATVEARAQGKPASPVGLRHQNAEGCSFTTLPTLSTQLPTPELPQVPTNAAAEPTPLPLKHGATLHTRTWGRGHSRDRWLVLVWSQVRWLVLRVMGGKSLR